MSKEGGFSGHEHNASRPHAIEVFPGAPRQVDNVDQFKFGPESLLPKLVADRRFALTGMSAGIEQLMYWPVGTGVVDHSDFFNDPWGRIRRSLPQIIGSVSDQNPEATAKKIRDYHKNIHGMDEQGRSYHALNDETFFLPHATFVVAAINIRNRFDRKPLSPVELERLYQESKIWYSLYGLSNRPVPKDYISFVEKWNDICRNKLEATPAAKAVVDKIKTGKVDRRPDIPKFLWDKLLLKLPGNELIRILAFGGLPPIVRRKMDIKWSLLDQWKLTFVEETVKYWDPKIPNISIDPRIRAGMEALRKRGIVV